MFKNHILRRKKVCWFIGGINLLVEISHGTVSFGADTILSDINFIIKNTEKIAIVGLNGCGKTTLLNLISGKIGFIYCTSGRINNWLFTAKCF